MTHSNSLQTETPSLNRREFLYYVLGGSIVLAAGGAAAGLLRFVTPESQKIDLRQSLSWDASDFPVLDQPRLLSARNFGSSFYYAMTNDTLLLLNRACTGAIGSCPVRWVDTNYRFECPCCGARFEMDGTAIEGPTKRGLDRYFTEIMFADGSTVTSNDAGDPIPLAGREIARVVVDTKRLIPGPPR